MDYQTDVRHVLPAVRVLHGTVLSRPGFDPSDVRATAECTRSGSRDAVAVPAACFILIAELRVAGAAE